MIDERTGCRVNDRFVEILTDLQEHMGTTDDPDWMADISTAIEVWQAMRDQREDEQRFGKPRS